VKTGRRFRPGRWTSRFVTTAAAVALAASTCAGDQVSTPSENRYTVDELVFLNGIGGFGDVGTLDVSRKIVSPGNTLGFSLKVVWEDHPRPPGWWSIRIPLERGPAGVDTFECDLYVENADDKASLNVFLYERDDDRWVCRRQPLREAPRKQWLHIRVPRSEMKMWYIGNHQAQWDRIHGLAIEPSGGKAVFYLDAARLTGPHGRSLPIFTVNDDGLRPDPSWRETPRWPRRAGVTYFPFDEARLDRKDLLETPLALARILGPTGAPIVGYGPTVVDKIRFLRAHGIEPVFYSAFASGYMRFLTRRQAWDVNADGRSLNVIPRYKTHWDARHTIALAHPAVTEALRHKVDALLAAGLGAWMVVDYTFPWWDTWWGYAPVMVDAYRRDLNGTDDGLVVRDGDRTETLHFPDYFRKYNGFYPSPADLGLKTWDEFTPPKPADAGSEFVRRRKIMFWYLRSWEWLKLPDRIGRYMQRKGGTGLWIIPNPEDTFGSSDYVFLVRSAGVSNLFPEWFGPIGWAAEAGYASLPYLREEANRGGARLSIIQETGAGGHSMPYLDWRIAFNGVFALTAAGGFDDFDNDFIDHAPFAVQSDPKAGGKEFVRFRDAAAKAFAFRLARESGFRRPGTRILCVSERPPAKSPGSIFFGLGRPHSLAVGLSRSHLVFDLRDSVELERVLSRYDVVAYTPWAPRPGDVQQLADWLRAKPGRILVTHSFVPTRSTTEFRQDNRDTSLGKSRDGRLLGLGRITIGNAPKRVRITHAAGAWASVLPPGTQVELTAPLTRCDGGAIMVKTDAGPLITEARVGRSTVVYLHYTPGDSITVQRDLDVPIVRAVALRAGVQPVCNADFDTLVQVFGKGSVRTVVAWDAPAMGKWKWAYRPGLPPMPFSAAGVRRRIAVPTGRSGTDAWLWYDLWSGRQARLSVHENAVEWELRDTVTGLFVVGPDDAVTRAEIAVLRRLREKMERLGFFERDSSAGSH